MDFNNAVFVTGHQRLIKLDDNGDADIDRPTMYRRSTNTGFIYIMAAFFAVLIGTVIAVCIAGRRVAYPQPSIGYGIFDFSQVKILDALAMLLFIAALILATLVLLRYCPTVVVWTMLVLYCVLIIFSMFAMLVEVFMNGGNYGKAIMMSVMMVGVLLLLAATMKRIPLIVQLFKEASKAIYGMPQLFILPVISFITSLLSVISVFALLEGIVSASISNVPGALLGSTIFLGYFGALWMIYFFMGCHTMIVGGTVAAWYFKRDKSALSAPMWTATYLMMRYHLGTVALGSLIMPILIAIKRMVRRCTGGANESSCCCPADSCTFIRWFTDMSYIMTAIHGMSFWTGCREATCLLVNNALSLLSLKTACHFIFGLLEVLVIIMVILMSMVIDNSQETSANMAMIYAFIAAFAIHGLFSIYTTAIDTIFLCYCEDIAENDGVNRPYFMSRKLMCVMEDSKKE